MSPITNSTERRVPRITGFPTSTFGSTVIRTCSLFTDLPLPRVGSILSGARRGFDLSATKHNAHYGRCILSGRDRRRAGRAVELGGVADELRTGAGVHIDHMPAVIDA